MFWAIYIFYCIIHNLFYQFQAALVYELDAECVFGHEQIRNKISKTIKMEGIGMLNFDLNI